MKTNVRTAKLMDYAQVETLCLEFLKEYITHADMYDQHDSIDREPRHRRRLQQLVQAWLQNEYVLIAEDDQCCPQGIIVAVREQNFWDPEIRVLREMIWYVRPEYRRHRLSAELYLHWQKDIKSLIDRGIIKYAAATMPAEHQTVDLSGRGWRAVETHWIRG